MRVSRFFQIFYFHFRLFKITQRTLHFPRYKSFSRKENCMMMLYVGSSRGNTNRRSQLYYTCAARSQRTELCKSSYAPYSVSRSHWPGRVVDIVLKSLDVLTRGTRGWTRNDSSRRWYGRLDAIILSLSLSLNDTIRLGIHRFTTRSAIRPNYSRNFARTMGRSL